MPEPLPPGSQSQERRARATAPVPILFRPLAGPVKHALGTCLSDVGRFRPAEPLMHCSPDNRFGLGPGK